MIVKDKREIPVNRQYLPVTWLCLTLSQIFLVKTTQNKRHLDLLLKITTLLLTIKGASDRCSSPVSCSICGAGQKDRSSGDENGPRLGSCSLVRRMNVPSHIMKTRHSCSKRRSKVNILPVPVSRDHAVIFLKRKRRQRPHTEHF